MTLPPLFEKLPEPFLPAFDPRRPWELLGEPLATLLEALPSSSIEIPLSPHHHLSGDGIVIGKGCRIHPTAVIEGPVFLGDDVRVGPGAYLRGGCWLGDGAGVGANVEVKHSILLPGSRAPHLSYVGDSILGSDVNLGAGSVLSNFRHDGRTIEIPSGDGRIDSGRRKLGALLGDGVRVGCNCVLHPGSIVGSGTSLYPGVQLRSGIYPAGSLIKLRQEIEIVERRAG